MFIGVPEILLAAITVISPIFTAIATQSKWDSKIKNAVAFGISLVLAVIYLTFTGGFEDPSNIPGVVLAVYGLQQLVYKQFMTELAKKVEAATSVKTGEKAVVAEDQKTVVEETGEDSAQVEIIENDTTPVEPDYQARHRGDVPLG